MKVLVINAGSSSCKYQLLEMDTQRVLCSGLAERIGQDGGRLTHKIAPDTDKETRSSARRPSPPMWKPWNWSSPC